MTDRVPGLDKLLVETYVLLATDRTPLVAFAALGLLQAGLAGVRTAVEFPMVVASFPRRGLFYPDLAVLPRGPTVTHPLVGTFLGLDPLLIAVYTGTVALGVAATTLAIATVAWRTDSECAGWLPPARRLAWLGTFVALVGFASTLTLAVGIPVSGWLWGSVLTFAVGYLVSRLFVAPVAIVREGRRPLSALHRSWVVSRRTSHMLAIPIVLLAFVRYWFSGFPLLDSIPEGSAVFADIALGTAVVGSVYAALMCVAYDLSMPQDP